MPQRLAPQAETLSGSPQPNFTAFQPAPVIAKRNPGATDTGYPLGMNWINKSGNTVYTLSSVAAGSAAWQALSSSTSSLATLTGNSGGALSPTASNINIVGSGGVALPERSTLTISLMAVATIETIVADSGSLVPSGGSVNAFGTANASYHSWIWSYTHPLHSNDFYCSWHNCFNNNFDIWHITCGYYFCNCWNNPWSNRNINISWFDSSWNSSDKCYRECCYYNW